MKRHTKIYFDYFKIEYDTQTGWHNCTSEISGLPATDIHHIDSRGMGGSRNKDNIRNLMALTREEHERYGDKPQFTGWLQKIHDDHIKRFAENITERMVFGGSLVKKKEN